MAREEKIKRRERRPDIIKSIKQHHHETWITDLPD